MDVLEELRGLISEIRFKIADVFQFGRKETIVYGTVKYYITNPSPEEGKENESRVIRFNSEIAQKTAERLEELGDEIKGMSPRQRLESAVACAVHCIEEVLRKALKKKMSIKENVVIEIGKVLTTNATAEEPTLTIDIEEEPDSRNPQKGGRPFVNQYLIARAGIFSPLRFSRPCSQHIPPPTGSFQDV